MQRDEARCDDGQLLYIKPAVYPGMPVDVTNYARAGKPFPQQSHKHART